jgi:hypothetical protein
VDIKPFEPAGAEDDTIASRESGVDAPLWSTPSVANPPAIIKRVTATATTRGRPGVVKKLFDTGIIILSGRETTADADSHHCTQHGFAS